MSLVGQIAELQDYATYKELTWEGRSRTTSTRPRDAAGHAQRVPAPLRHDPVARRRGVHRQQEEARPLQLLQATRSNGGANAIFGLDIPLMRLVHVLKARARGLRPREARHPAARPGRLVEVAPSRACSRRASSTTRARPTARSTRSTGSNLDEHRARRRRRASASRARCTRSRCASSRASGAPKAIDELGLVERPVQGHASTATSIPACRFIFKELMTQVRAATGRR